VSTSNHPSEEYQKQKQAYFMAIEALNYRISMEATNALQSSNYAIPYEMLLEEEKTAIRMA
jgi:hypothetical protein